MSRFSGIKPEYGSCEGSDGHTRLDQLEEAAEARNCRIVEPTEHELQIDVDSDVQKEHVKNLVNSDKIIKMIGIKKVLVTPSPSGRPGHYHVTIILKDPVLHETHRVFLQALLGSDPVREFLAWERISQGIKPVSVFFEKIEESQAW